MLAEKPSALSDARRLSQRVQFERDGTVSIASGKVELGRDLSYRFRVKAQGVRFTLTDENEKRRLSLPTGRGVA